MSDKNIDEVIELLSIIPQMGHRKILRNVFRGAVSKIGGGITEHHLRILKILQEPGSSHMTEIGDKIAVSKSQMTHSTDRLIDLGMIERHTDEKDRRKINIRLTAKGRETIENIGKEIRESMRVKLSNLSEGDLDKLRISLRNMTDIFEKMQ